MWKPMKLSQLEKRIQQTMANSKDIIQSSRNQRAAKEMQPPKQAFLGELVFHQTTSSPPFFLRDSKASSTIPGCPGVAFPVTYASLTQTQPHWKHICSRTIDCSKLFCVCCVLSFNTFENNTMKLSVNGAKLTGLQVRNCATVQQVCLPARKVSGSFGKRAPDPENHTLLSNTTRLGLVNFEKSSRVLCKVRQLSSRSCKVFQFFNLKFL